MSRRSVLSFVGLVSLVGLAAGGSGCSASSDDGKVTPRLEVINRTKSALTASSITSVTGTYGGLCGGRDALGTDAWMIDTATPGNTTLSVQKNDGDCVLTVTQITAGGAFIGDPAIALDTGWQLSGSSFALSGGSRAFYGNAKISATDFANDFVISILVSDNASPSTAGAAPGAEFAQQSGTVESATVAASTYTLGFGAMTVQKDANNAVLSTSGYAQLTLPVSGVAGEDYAIVEGNLTSATFAQVDTAYTAATLKGALADLVDPLNPTDPVEFASTWFTLEDNDLDTATWRTVIIRHTVSGVSSYQYFSVHFQ